MSYIVLVTHLETNDIDVVGAFADREDAVAWAADAFHDPRWKDCLFRVQRMRARDEAPPAASRNPYGEGDPAEIDGT